MKTTSKKNEDDLKFLFFLNWLWHYCKLTLFKTINVFASNCNCALLTKNHPGTMSGNVSGHYSSLWVSMLMANTWLAKIGVMCIGTGVIILVWAISLTEACPILKNVQNMSFSWCNLFVSAFFFRFFPASYL